MRLLVIAAAAVAMSGPATAQTIMLRVVDTAANDVLNVREYPTAASRIVGTIPPDATTVEFLHEVRNGWAYVRFRRFEGWASTRFLRAVTRPVRRGFNLDDFTD